MKSKEQLQADFQNGTLDEVEHRAYLLTQVKAPSDKVGAGMLVRALDAAGKTIQTADTAFFNDFLHGSYLNDKGKALQPTTQQHLNGAKAFFQKSVADIGYQDPHGNLITPVLPELLTALETAQLQVGKSKEQLQADFQNGTLDEAEHRAYLLTQVKAPSDKAGVGMLVRALDAAGKTIQTADTAFFNDFLYGSYFDDKGKALQPTTQQHLNGAKAFFQKSVADIGYQDPHGNRITPVLPELLTALETAQLQVGKSKEQLQADFQNGTLDEAEHRAYLLTQVKGPRDKAGAGMLVRALDAAGLTIQTADTAFFNDFLNGSYLDDKGKALQPTAQQHLNGAKAFFQKSVTPLQPYFLQTLKNAMLPVTRNTVQQPIQPTNVHNGQSDVSLVQEGLEQDVDAGSFSLLGLPYTSGGAIASSSFTQDFGSRMFLSQPGRGALEGTSSTLTSSGRKRAAPEELSSLPSKRSQVNEASSSRLTAPYAGLIFPNDLRPEDALQRCQGQTPSGSGSVSHYGAGQSTLSTQAASRVNEIGGSSAVSWIGSQDAILSTSQTLIKKLQILRDAKEHSELYSNTITEIQSLIGARRTHYTKVAIGCLPDTKRGKLSLQHLLGGKCTPENP